LEISADRVLDDELAVIRRAHPSAPPPQTELVGLALSGGGVRSAAFCLGVLEALKNLDLLERVHYLSTVGGGSYIGAWLTINCLRSRLRQEPDWRGPGAAWEAAVGHLSRACLRLGPPLSLYSAETWTVAAVWLRNAFLLLLTLASTMACLLLVPRLLVGLFSRPRVDVQWLIVDASALALVLAIDQSRARGAAARTGLPFAAGLALSFVSIGLALALVVTFALHPSGAAVPVSYVIATFMVIGAYAAVQVLRRASLYRERSRTPHFVGPLTLHIALTGVLVAAIGLSSSIWAAFPELLLLQASFGELLAGGWRFWPFGSSVWFAGLFLLAFVNARQGPHLKAALTSLMGAPIAALVFHAALCLTVWMFRAWWSNGGIAHALVVGPPLILAGYAASIVLLSGLTGSRSRGEGDDGSELAAWLFMYGLGWLGLAIIAVYAPSWTYASVSRTFWTTQLALASGMALVVAGLLVAHAQQKRTGRILHAAWVAVVPHLAGYVFLFLLLVVVATALDLIILSNDGGTWWTVVESSAARRFVSVSAVTTLLCVAIGLSLATRIDVNEVGVAALMRDRLTRCFLGATRHAFGPHAVEPGRADSRLVDAILPDGTMAGPLHLFNAALVLGSGGGAGNVAPFEASPLYVGSHYRSEAPDGTADAVSAESTTSYARGQFSIGQAMAASGLAEGPTDAPRSPLVAFLLTAFGLRLSWWLPRPGLAARFNLLPAFSELFGGVSRQSRHLLIGDGGRFDNLGAYQLIKRRCRVVVVVDAERDARFEFGGLMSLIRICKADLGAQVDVDIRAMMPKDASPWSEQRHAVGTVSYSDGTTTSLVYLKAAMTGDEPTVVRGYRASHPAFPQETVGHQLDSEDQFDAYRHLGFDVTSDAFQTALAKVPAASARDFVPLAAAMADAQSVQAARRRGAENRRSFGRNLAESGTFGQTPLLTANEAVPYDLFVSFSHHDHDRVSPLVKVFEEQGWTVFWAPYIRTGVEWETLIERELKAARCVVVVWSAQAVASDWVRAEARTALARKVLVPVKLDEVAIPLRYDNIQTFDLTRWTAQPSATPLEGLVASIAVYVAPGRPSAERT